MRISDWSSDVCSSDLLNHRIDPFGRDGLDAKHHLAIIEKQPHFRFKRSIDFRVRQVHAIGVPRCLVAIESELCSNLQQSDAVDEDPYPQLRPLKISQNGCGAAKFLFQGAERCNPPRMIGMVAMANRESTRLNFSH